MTSLKFMVFCLTVSNLVFGQIKPYYFYHDYDVNFDCSEYADLPKSQTDLARQLRFIQCTVQDRGNLDRAIFMLDSLYASNKDSRVLESKIHWLAFYRPYDTVYLSMQRDLIRKGQSRSWPQTFMGIFYMNFVAVCGSDTSHIKLSRNERIHLLELSKFYLNKGVMDSKISKSIALVLLPNIDKELASLKGIETPPLTKSVEFDSLTIIADVIDCGEFGAHYETIKIYKHNRIFSAKFWSDSIECQKGFAAERPIYHPTNTTVSFTKNILSNEFFQFIESGYQSNEHFRIYVYVNDNLREYSGWHNKGTSREKYEAFKRSVFE